MNVISSSLKRIYSIRASYIENCVIHTALQIVADGGKILNSFLFNVASFISLETTNCTVLYINYSDPGSLEIQFKTYKGYASFVTSSVILRNVSFWTNGLIDYPFFDCCNSLFSFFMDLMVDVIFDNVWIDSHRDSPFMVINNILFDYDYYSNNQLSFTFSIQNSFVNNCSNSTLFYIEINNEESYLVSEFNLNVELEINLWNTSFDRNSKVSVFEFDGSTVFSKIALINCFFTSNVDVSLTETQYMSVNISNSTFLWNVNYHKGLLDLYNTVQSVQNTRFISNICNYCSMITIRDKSASLNSFPSSSLFIRLSNLTIRDCASIGFGSVMQIKRYARVQLNGFDVDLSTSSVGGCLYIDISTNVRIENSRFSRCTASGSNGGSIYLGTLGNLTITSSVFSNSAALFLGGAILVETSSLLVVRNSRFDNCSSGLHGGCIFLSRNVESQFSDCSFSGSFAVRGAVFYSLSKLSLDRCTAFSNSAEDRGGVIFLSQNSSFSSADSIFSLNRASYGGVICSTAYSFSNVLNSTFFENCADRFGGAVLAESLSEIMMNNCTFSGNIAESGGAVFTMVSTFLDLRNSILKFNQAVSIAQSCTQLSGCGGALLVTNMENSIIISQNNDFVSNFADRFGGALGFSISGSGMFNVSKLSDFGLFLSNSARFYGSNFASFFLRVEAKILDGLIYKGELFNLHVQFYDGFNQLAFPGSCTLHVIIEPRNYSETRFAVEPSSFDLSSFSGKGNQTELVLSLALFYRKALLSFPSVIDTFDYQIKILVNDISSNIVRFRVQSCRPGFALEADPVLFYKCVPCLSGAFLNVSDTSNIVCSKCPLGKYSPALSNLCIQCEEGRFASDLGGSDSCALCPLGTYATAKSQSSCFSCPIGKFSNQSGAQICSFCPFDSITFSEKSENLESCICPPGSFGNPREKECLTCPKFKGLRCEANSTIPFVHSGYWRLSDTVSIAQQCIPLQACMESGFQKNTPCASGYESKRCGKCVVGKFKSVDICNDCPRAWVIALILCVLILASLGISIYLIFFSNGFYGRASLRPILVAIQSLGVLSRFFSKDSYGGNSLSRLLSFLDLSNFNFEFIFGIDCVFRIGYWSLFSMKILMLVIIPGAFLGTVYALEKYRCIKQKNDLAKVKFSIFDRCISIMVMLTSTFYTYVLSLVLSAFRCYPQEDNSYTLLSSPSLDFAMIPNGFQIYGSSYLECCFPSAFQYFWDICFGGIEKIFRITFFIRDMEFFGRLTSLVIFYGKWF
jgi:hypothetical protein